jgi:hypothetical protein
MLLNYYFSNFFFSLNIFSQFEHILLLLFICFFKKQTVWLFILPLNNFVQSTIINFNLLNGIMNIHPCVYLLVFNNISTLYSCFFLKKKTALCLVIYNFSILLLLGSFWAAQELSWGG